MAFHVGEGGVVEPPRVAEVRKLLVVTPLLPVEPPKVYAHLFEGSQLGIEPSLHESLARGLPRYVLLRGGVHAHVACHGGIVFPQWLFSVGRVGVRLGEGRVGEKWRSRRSPHYLKKKYCVYVRANLHS